MIQNALAGLLLWPSTAQAESAQLIPPGSKVVYIGVGSTTSRKLRYGDGDTLNGSGQTVQDATLDRLLSPRIDLYASIGLKPWLQVSAWIPVVATFALSDDSTGPCPDQGPAGFCDSAHGIGSTGAELRAGMLGGDLSLTPALALTSDIWNSGSRGQYTSLGTAVVSIIPGFYVGYQKGMGSWRAGIVAHANYAWNVGRRRIDTGPDAPLQAPANDAIEAVEFKLGLPLPLELSGALEGAQRLGGLDWEGDYYANYWVDNADRWGVLRYEELVVRGKLSVALPHDMGLHFQAGKVVDVRNGPPDTWDFGVGWHKYFAPRKG